MNIKSSLKQFVLEDFRAFNGWLDKSKLNHGIREKQISGEFLNVSETTVESWMERIKQLCTAYDCQNIWNMDESGYFKALPSKGMGKKRKENQRWQKIEAECDCRFLP